MATDVQWFFKLKSQYIEITRNVHGFGSPHCAPQVFPNQPREFVRKVIRALISLQLIMPPAVFLPALPSPGHMSPILGREKSGSVNKRGRQDALENEMNVS